MAILGRTIPAFFIVSIACFYCAPASAENAVKTFRIGLIGTDPIQLLHDFDPFAEYLKKGLRPSGIRDVTVFVAKDMDQMRGRIQEGSLDFVLTSAFPIIAMEQQALVPAVVALQGAARQEYALFFVRNESTAQKLGDLRGKTVAFGTPWSTAGYAIAKAELKKNKLFVRDPSGQNAPEDVRYTFAGEAINRAVLVIRDRADAGVCSTSDWEELPLKEQSRLRVIHRTAPATRLLGSFHPSVPPALREAVERALINMSGNSRGQAALARALKMTTFERVTVEDRNALQHLKQQLSDVAKP